MGAGATEREHGQAEVLDLSSWEITCREAAFRVPCMHGRDGGVSIHKIFFP